MILSAEQARCLAYDVPHPVRKKLPDWCARRDTSAANRLPAPGHTTHERTGLGIRTTTTLPNGATVVQHKMRG